ncbi:MAG: hypothetical protein ABIR81_03635 [Ginsengibacter sp.]
MKKMLHFAILFNCVSLFGFAQSGKVNGQDKDKSTHTNSKETTAYNSRIYNACTKEWITLKGTVTYSIKEMRSDDRYFIMYDIDLSKITGVGETTGTEYKGGGHIKDKVIANNKNNHVTGNDKYKVKYRSANSSITIEEHAHYVMANGETKVSFNDAVDSCE